MEICRRKLQDNFAIYTYQSIDRCLKRIFFVTALFISLFAQAQSLTGTWLAAYYRDQPGNKRIFYYRIYLQQKQDSIYGIYQALDALSDVKGIDPEQAEVQASYKVYQHNIAAVRDSTRFDLSVGEQLERNVSNHDVATPTFHTLECKTIQPNKDFYLHKPQLIHSLLPAADGPIGKLTVTKISDTIPNWINSEWQVSTRKIKLPKIDIKGLKRPGLFQKKEETEAPVTDLAEINLIEAVKQRIDDIQKVIELDTTVVTIELYDNGVVDNDIVSVFLNDQLLIAQKKLTEAPISLEIKLENNKENKFTLFAHNEGNIPPNTALLVVKAGGARHSILLKSSLQQNSVVIFTGKKADQ